MRINYNIPAMIANNALKLNDNKLTESTKRLTTGMKVAGAKDNPSGLAMSRRMNAQIKSLDRATDNASDGISVIQTADGALNEVHDILQRMNELAVQAANGTNSDSDLKSIQEEIDQLKQEITRISDATQFNGQTLLDGTFDYKGYLTTTTVDADGNTIRDVDGVTPIYSTDPEMTLAGYSDGIISGTYVIGGYNLLKDTDMYSAADRHPEDGTDEKYSEDVLRAEYDSITGEVTLYDQSGNAAEDLHLSVYKLREDGKYELYMDKARVTAESDVITIAGDDGRSIELQLKQDYNRKVGTDKSKENVDKDEAQVISLELTAKGPMTMQIGANEGQTLDMRIPAVTLANLGLEYTDFTRTVRVDVENNLRRLTTSDTVPVPQNDGGLTENAWNDILEYGKTLKAFADKVKDEVFHYSDPTAARNFDHVDADLAREITLIDQEYEDYYYDDYEKEVERNSKIERLLDDRYMKLPNEIEELDKKTNADGTPATQLEKLSTFVNDNFITTDWQKKLDKVLSDYDKGELADWQAGFNMDKLLNGSYDEGMIAPHSGADDAITAIGNAIKKVSQIRSRLGAYQNRLEHTVKANDGTSENMTAAYSRIMDVDVAEEMTVYSTQQVLSQAGTSMLAQANERPSQILQLLQ